MSEKIVVMGRGRGQTVPIMLDPDTTEVIAGKEQPKIDLFPYATEDIHNARIDQVKNAMGEIKKAVAEKRDAFSFLKVPKEEIDEYTYIELKNVLLSIKDAKDQLHTLDLLRASFNSLSEIAGDIATASVLHNNDLNDVSIEKYDDAAKEMKESLESLETYINETLSKKYPDTTKLFTSFLTKEMVRTLDRKYESLRKELDSLTGLENPDTDKIEKVKKSIDDNYVQRTIYNDRANAVHYFLDELLKNNSCPYRKEIRKVKQYTKNIYEKTFVDTKKELCKYFSSKNLTIFDRAMKELCQLPLLTRVQIFVLFNRIMSRLRFHSRSDITLYTAMKVIIMNLNDIYVGLWDEDMEESKEFVLETMDSFLTVFNGK